MTCTLTKPVSITSLTAWSVFSPVIVALLAVGVRFSIGPQTVDDAYITFRYARNIASGLGFVYNFNEQILGTTTPLWTLILAFCYRIGLQNLPHIAAAIGSLCDGVTAVLVYAIVRRIGFGPLWSALAAFLFAVSAGAIVFTIGGMETPLFTLLLIAGVAAQLARRPIWASVLAGLATVTRPEGVLLFILILISELWLRRRPWLPLIAYLLVVLPWLLFASIYFGSPLPQSVVAKSVVYSPQWGGALRVLTQLGLPAFSVTLTIEGQQYSLFAILVTVPILLIFLSRVGCLFRYARGAPEALPLMAFAPLLAAAYILATLRGVQFFRWYVSPLVPFYIIGLVVFVAGLSKHWARPAKLVVVALLMAWFVLPNLGRQAGAPLLLPRGVLLTREAAYLKAAELLAPLLSPGTIVALPIGAFGWASTASILDTVGLVSPEATAYYPLGPEYSGHTLPADLVADMRPHYIVSLDVFAQPPLTEAPWFRRDYRLLATIDSPFDPFSAQYTYVYELRPSP